MIDLFSKFIAPVIDMVFSWLEEDFFGFGGVFIFVLTLSCVYRFLLYPITGRGTGSDSVKKGKR